MDRASRTRSSGPAGRRARRSWRRSTSPRRSRTASRCSCHARRRWERLCLHHLDRPGQPERGDTRAAGHAPRGRSRDRPEDPRSPHRARRLSVGRGARCRARHRAGDDRGASRAGGAVIGKLSAHVPHLLLAGLCAGIASANAVRVQTATACPARRRRGCPCRRAATGAVRTAGDRPGARGLLVGRAAARGDRPEPDVGRGRARRRRPRDGYRACSPDAVRASHTRAHRSLRRPRRARAGPAPAAGG